VEHPEIVGELPDALSGRGSVCFMRSPEKLTKKMNANDIDSNHLDWGILQI
jgi:hypothetical protein